MIVRNGLMLAIAAATLGCQRPGSAEAPSPARQPEQPSLKHMISSQRVPNDLRQIAIFYRTYNLEFNRSPASLAEFKKYIQRDARKLAALLDEGVYIVIWKANEPTSSTLIAYEKQADELGQRWVALGDGAVQKKDGREFQKLLAGAKSNSDS